MEHLCTTARSWVQCLGLAYTCHCAKAVELFSPPFPMAHHKTNLQRQGHVANLVYNKCSPQNNKRGGGLGGSKVGWVGPKLGGWVLSKIPPPPPPYKACRPSSLPPSIPPAALTVAQGPRKRTQESQTKRTIACTHRAYCASA